MTSIPKVITGTYDGRPFELKKRLTHFDGSAYIKQVEAYVLEFENCDVKYVLDCDPLLKFDPIRTDG